MERGDSAAGVESLPAGWSRVTSSSCIVAVGRASRRRVSASSSLFLVGQFALRSLQFSLPCLQLGPTEVEFGLANVECFHLSGEPGLADVEISRARGHLRLEVLEPRLEFGRRPFRGLAPGPFGGQGFPQGSESRLDMR